ncbi:alpha/beta fold hydrolase [Sandaracinobacteroides saxicola]|uniref:Alpha/beta fold hydrolase n=1 Tax=Sandaracinobacteroides saxicola TaxID=2759707 RepID=A0A7G5IL81_9SPHN|nr:alpha/beta fold hydrolase [Sandaracinobacteroides saxicola]QMW24123.1 alpha/beta fold hydrolase [Sandaracinobacteroides saxicola]
MKRFYLDGRWGQVHGREAGDGPSLLLLHQSPLSGAMFDPALPLLAAAGFRAIALDTPGFGLSDPPPNPASIPDHADALLTILDALGLTAPHILGHHTGALIAANLAARHPARVGKLILNGVPWLTPDERAHFATFRFAPLDPAPDGSHLTAAWAQRLRASPGWSNLPAMHKHVTEMLRIPDRYHWGFIMALSHDMTPDLAAITAPTLVLSNSGEDLYAASRRAAAHRADWAFTALDSGTHDIVDEQPGAWAAAVTRFLNS